MSSNWAAGPTSSRSQVAGRASASAYRLWTLRRLHNYFKVVAPLLLSRKLVVGATPLALLLKTPHVENLAAAVTRSCIRLRAVFADN